ncbi:RING-type E3 ubiquitin transferase [Salvia divinorum]|uniref:RING-type E3 ubiquitin transferase n=1 Tax=Salvia divinorum TaxID=28513 RepID=A0ABD1G9S7_SALDI
MSSADVAKGLTITAVNSSCQTSEVGMKKPLSLNQLHEIAGKIRGKIRGKSNTTLGKDGTAANASVVQIGKSDVNKESIVDNAVISDGGCGNASSGSMTTTEKVKTITNITVNKEVGVSEQAIGSVRGDQVSGKIEVAVADKDKKAKNDGKGENSDVGNMVVLTSAKGTKRPREVGVDTIENPPNKENDKGSTIDCTKGKEKVIENKGKGKTKVCQTKEKQTPVRKKSSNIQNHAPGSTDLLPCGTSEVDPNDPNDLEVVVDGSSPKRKKKHQSMKLKRSPYKIIEVMQSLNDRQRAAVYDIGFGELNHFGISEIPGKMAYQLLDGFDGVSCSIKLESRTLEMTPDDVYVTLGLPKGPSGDGYCRTPIAYLYNDIENVKDYNWCAYTLDSLVLAQTNWKKSNDSPFTGPISFLVAFYVDRVFHKTLLVSRVFPTVSGWTVHSALFYDPPHLDGMKDRSVTAIGMNNYPDTEKSYMSVGCSARQSDATKDNDIDVDEIVKSVVDAYMECGYDDDDKEDLDSFVNHSGRKFGNEIVCCDMSKDNAIDVEAVVKSAVNAYMECDDNDDDFVTPCLKKTESKLGNQLVVYGKENVIKVSSKLKQDERIMYYWLMTTYNTNEEQLVYDDDVIEVRVIEFMSLLPHKEVSSGIISAWCSALNNMEDLRAPASPKRLFFTTYPAHYTIVESDGQVDVDARFNTFAQNLDKEVREIPEFKWRDIDMVFFPFCVFKRDYAVCFCFHRKAVVIIDGCKDGDDRDVRFNYGHIPETLLPRYYGIGT